MLGGLLGAPEAVGGTDGTSVSKTLVSVSHVGLAEGKSVSSILLSSIHVGGDDSKLLGGAEGSADSLAVTSSTHVGRTDGITVGLLVFMEGVNEGMPVGLPVTINGGDDGSPVGLPVTIVGEGVGSPSMGITVFGAFVCAQLLSQGTLRPKATVLYWPFVTNPSHESGDKPASPEDKSPWKYNCAVA